MARVEAVAGAGLRIVVAPALASGPQRRAGGAGRDLVADQDHVAWSRVEALEAARDVARRQRRVRAAGDRDAVLAGASTRMNATPGRLALERQQPADIDALRLERRPRRGPEVVVADRTDEDGPGARAVPRRPPGCRPCRRGAGRSDRR